MKLTKNEIKALSMCSTWLNGVHPGNMRGTFKALAEKGLVYQNVGRNAHASGSNWWHLTEAGKAALEEQK